MTSHGLARRKAAETRNPEDHGGPLSPAEARELFGKLVSEENRKRLGVVDVEV